MIDTFVLRAGNLCSLWTLADLEDVGIARWLHGQFISWQHVRQ